MLLTAKIDTDTFVSYEVNGKKTIEFFCDEDRSINMIALVNHENYEVSTFEPKNLWYMENITEYNGCLNTTLLQILVEQEEHGYVKA